MPRKSLDLTGQRYGYLTVLERVGSSPKGAALWLCHCSRCGQDCILEGQRIPQKTDCGCAYREKRADLTGQHIGVLQVIRRTGRSKHGDALYLCRCDLCGQEKEIPASTIRARLQSCGCMRALPERMAEMSKLGVKSQIQGGIQISSLTREEGNRNSKTGVRGVFPYRGGYVASCQVRGIRWRSPKFDTIPEAQKALEVQKETMLANAGLTTRPNPGAKNKKGGG